MNTIDRMAVVCDRLGWTVIQSTRSELGDWKGAGDFESERGYHGNCSETEGDGSFDLRSKALANLNEVQS